MKVNAGEWQKKSFLEKADMLIYASNNNHMAYLMRIIKGETRWITRRSLR